MAAKTQPDTAPAMNPMDIMESVYIPKAAGEDANVFVGLNGKAWIIPRGKRCEVPKPVADILRMSEEAKDKADEYAASEREKKNTVFGA